MKSAIFKLTLFAFALLLLTNCKRSVQSYSAELEVPVSVKEIVPSTIESFINTTGSVYALKDATLNTEIAGRYRLQKNPATGKPYALGDKVKTGEDIIKIEDKEYENGIRIKSIQLDLEISKQELEKQKSLYEKGGVTMRELKDAEIQEINTEYEMENAQLSLAKMTVTAPFDGTIVNLPYFTPGTRVASGTEVLRITNNKELYLEANLPEKYFPEVKENMNVYITNYNVPDDTLHGVINQIAPAIDPDARTFKTFITIDNGKGLLLPGMFVKADLVAKRSENTIVIPKDIIRGRGRVQSVFIAESGYSAERRITTGIENNDYVEVTEGLSVGDKLITRGYETLRNRSKLKIVE
ncbi:efflux RND transporter periplasmic adaptor subunit [Saccharicrinis sp. FJH54]|uniref:efflux RND transporter periplasmic adaptor subunit n=1 Tax=Saccharicrinis sp. FJH54 TaxID=3344665 RepID=UPI0035D45645